MCMIFKGCDEDSSADIKPKRADDGERSVQSYRMNITSKLPAEIAFKARVERDVFPTLKGTHLTE